MIATWPEFWARFHRRWGSDRAAKYISDYDKTEWGQMQAFLESVERGLAGAEAATALEAANELRRARTKFPAFHSAHEGYAVILEELDELWEQVKQTKPGSDRRAMRDEAVQVAAMALRFIEDVCDR